MRFLETNEIEEWCAERRLRLADDGALPDDPKLVHAKRATYARGHRSGREWAVAAACVRALGRWDECLLWVRNWGIWPSSEDWPAYYALRGARGEQRSLEKAPGHLFAPAEEELVATFLTQVMQNGWDAELLPVASKAPATKRVHVSHDEWLEIRSTTPTDFTPVAV
jgi:hypothetical protein